MHNKATEDILLAWVQIVLLTGVFLDFLELPSFRIAFWTSILKPFKQNHDSIRILLDIERSVIKKGWGLLCELFKTSLR